MPFTLKTNLRIYRKRKGMPATVLAKKAGTSTTHLDRLEKNESIPSIFLAYRIANVLGTSMGKIWEMKKLK